MKWKAMVSRSVAKYSVESDIRNEMSPEGAPSKLR